MQKGWIRNAYRSSKNIYKQVVPLPNNPLRNQCLLHLGEKNLMIDTGLTDLNVKKH